MSPTFRLKPGKYVAAVSGGIDSVVLLDLLSRQGIDTIVAHFDHGIRDDSHTDARHVEDLTRRYGHQFAVKRADLGARASEERARNERYAFLHRVKDFHKADAIITAHHADDVVETMIINLIRGTGWRGLSSLRSHPSVVRPLLNWRKVDIVRHAIDNQLTWREDSTNDDVRYLRNRVRHGVANRLHQHTERMLRYYAEQRMLLEAIEAELKQLSPQFHTRYFYVMAPDDAAMEGLRYLLSEIGATLTRDQLTRALWFIRTAREGKRLNIAASVEVRVSRTQAFVETPSS